jgi:NACHT domain
VLVRNHLFGLGILTQGWVVLERVPTKAMLEGGEANHIRVISIGALLKSFIDYSRYKNTRVESAFGSAVDPITGVVDHIQYVAVKYIERSTQQEYDARDLANVLLAGDNIVLLGEYGSGKSRCISEIFKHLAERSAESFQFALAINLRDCWGLRRADELIRRHINTLGLDEMAPSVVRAFNQKILIFLFDGFDELGTQSWSSDDARLRQLRAQALAGVKDAVQSCGTGTPIAGREHYFSSNQEMLKTLGLNSANIKIVYAKDEFSVEEISAYFEAAGIDVALPEWLPRRPLICQTIAQLDEDELGRMFGSGSQEPIFWNHFIRVLCQRDARINASFDADTIYRVFVELARLTRDKAADVGPISQRELQDAFEAVVGRLPVEEASVMLQRLPSLGRIGPESSDRQFIDGYILDGLRAHDVARLPS